MSEDETTRMRDSDFETSDRLKAIDTQIEEVEARLAEIESERGQATTDRADGVEGAQERLDGLHDETDRLKRELHDLKAARETETKRLADEHAKAVQQAQNERLELLEADRKAAHDAAKTVDKHIQKLEAALNDFHAAARKLDTRRHQAEARPFRTDYIADEIGAKLHDLVTEKRVRYDRAPLVNIAPDIEQVSDRAWWPTKLDDFGPANDA